MGSCPLEATYAKLTLNISGHVKVLSMCLLEALTPLFANSATAHAHLIRELATILCCGGFLDPQCMPINSL